MKKTTILLVAMVLSVTLKAQNSSDSIDLFQSIFGIEKNIIVGDFISVEGEAKTAFWEVHKQYEAERKEQGKEKYRLLDQYVNSYYEIDDKTAAGLMKQTLAIRKKDLKLLTKYYKKMSKACGAKVGAQFYQIENYFSNTMTLAISESIPFVGELD